MIFLPSMLFSNQLRSCTRLQTRFLHSTRIMAATKDWNATQYLRFEEERTRPSQDLAARIPLQSPRHIVDLGCGPGNSTAVLASRFPKAHVTGLDSSPDMIEKAKKRLPGTEFTLADLNSYTPSGPVDVFYSNATFQWLPPADRINVITKLIKSQESGGIFAFQVPDNLSEPSHDLMRQTALDGPWASTFKSFEGRYYIQSPLEMYDHLKPLCSTVDMWHTTYYHVLDGHEAIVEWVKSTGLRPFIDPLSPDQREGFLEAYLHRIKEAYPLCYDGKVILPFPRFFMVAVKA